MNSVTDLQVVAGIARREGMSRSRLVRAYLIDTKYEFIRMLRNTTFLIPILVIPPVMYLIFGVAFINSFDQNAFGDVPRVDVLKMMFTNFAVFSILGPSMVSLGTLLAQEREMGLLSLKRALPMPTLAPLLAKALFMMLVIFTLLVLLTVEAVVLGKLEFTVTQYGIIWAVCVLGALPFAAMGLYLGARLSGTAASGVVSGVYMTMAMVGGLLFPLPANFAWIALFSPAYYLSQLGLAAAGLHTLFEPLFPAIVLLVITALFTPLAMRRIRHSGN
jgi:ABC-2 type transport system permease protein